MLRRNVYLSCWGVIGIACLGVLLTACAPAAAGEGWVYQLPRPEDAAREQAGCPRAAVHVHAVHDFPNDDRLLLYSGTCPPIPEQPWPKTVRGFVLFEPKNGPLRRSGTAEIDNQAPIPHDAFLEYVSGGVTTPGAVYTYAYGRVLSPEVATIEALVDTGTVVRANISDGRYGVIAAARKGICAMRIVGIDGQVLLTTTLAVADSGTGVPRAEIRPGGIDAWGGSQAEPARCAMLQW